MNQNSQNAEPVSPQDSKLPLAVLKNVLKLIGFCEYLCMHRSHEVFFLFFLFFLQHLDEFPGLHSSVPDPTQANLQLAERWVNGQFNDYSCIFHQQFQILIDCSLLWTCNMFCSVYCTLRNHSMDLLECPLPLWQMSPLFSTCEWSSFLTNVPLFTCS